MDNAQSPLGLFKIPPQQHQQTAYTQHSSSRWTFPQGLIVGQISMVIIALCLMRYVIFEDSDTALEKERLMRLKISERRSKRHARALLENAKRAAAHRPAGVKRTPALGKATFASILEKTGYDISTHASESTDWLNVMMALAVAGYREDALAGGVSNTSTHTKSSKQPGAGINLGGLFGVGTSNPALSGDLDTDMEPEKERTARDLMEEILNRQTSNGKSSFLDPIRVTEADFGDSYPIFTNARVRPADDTGRMRIEVDVDYSDQVTLAIDTKLLINFPKPRFAVLPISLSLTIIRFSGTLAVELFSSNPNASVLHSTAKSHPDNPPPRSRHQLHFSLHPDFAFEASASSLLGSRAKLQDIPKIEQLLISRLRGWILDRFVWPRYWSLTLPNLVPSPAAESATSEESVAEGEMRVGTGVEDTNDDSIVVPGHLESQRQEQQQQQAGKVARSEVATEPLAGSVEAWRANTAGIARPGFASSSSIRPSPITRSSFASSHIDDPASLRRRPSFLHS